MPKASAPTGNAVGTSPYTLQRPNSLSTFKELASKAIDADNALYLSRQEGQTKLLAKLLDNVECQSILNLFPMKTMESTVSMLGIYLVFVRLTAESPWHMPPEVARRRMFKLVAPALMLEQHSPDGFIEADTGYGRSSLDATRAGSRTTSRQTIRRSETGNGIWDCSSLSQVKDHNDIRCWLTRSIWLLPGGDGDGGESPTANTRVIRAIVDSQRTEDVQEAMDSVRRVRDRRRGLVEYYISLSL